MKCIQFGDVFLFTYRGNGKFEIVILHVLNVYYNGISRFWCGWNRFVREYKVEVNYTLIFKMVEEEYHIVFHV